MLSTGLVVMTMVMMRYPCRSEEVILVMGLSARTLQVPVVSRTKESATLMGSPATKCERWQLSREMVSVDSG